MSRTKEQLLEDSIRVMNETEAEANSAGRIGGLIYDIAEHIGEGGGGGGNPFPTPSSAGYLHYNGSQYLWSNISINPSLNSGIQIATFNINGQSGALYAPTASSGGGITLNDVWSSLAANDSTKQIHSSHLSSYIGNFTFWGNTFGSSPNTSTELSGRIIAPNGIQIGDALLVYDSTNGGFLKVTSNNGTMNLCATGGVSALGMGSSGGGGGGGGEVTLNQPLSSINSSGLSAPGSSQNGKTLIWNNNNGYWEYGSFATESFVTSQGYLTVERDPTVPIWAKQPTKPNYSFSELTSHPTTLAGYGITNAYISNGTIYLGGNSITPLTSHQSLDGYATQSWVNNWFVKDAGGNLGSADKIYSIGCKRIFSGYNMPDAPVDNRWVSGIVLGSNWNDTHDNHYQHYLVESGDRWYTTREYSSGSMSGWNTFAYLTDNVASATKLQTARSLWGNNFDGTANIGALGSNASLNYVADINMSGNLTCQNILANENVRIHEVDDWWWAFGYQAGQQNGKFNIARYNSTGSGAITVPLSINPSDSSISTAGNIHEGGNFFLMNYANYGLMVEGYANQGTLHRSSFGLHAASGIIWSQLSGTDDIIMQLIVDTNRTFAKRYAQFNDGIKIGDGMIVWDSINNAFQIIKSDGTAANLYTTGGVSALGMSAGVSSIDAMKFGYLKVNSRLILPSEIVAGMSATITQYANDYDCIYLFNDSATSKINSKTYYFTQYDNVGIHGTDYNYSDTWYIDPDGCASFKRLYLSDTVYLYTNGSDIKVTIGSTTYTLTKS